MVVEASTPGLTSRMFRTDVGTPPGCDTRERPRPRVALFKKIKSPDFIFDHFSSSALVLAIFSGAVNAL